MTIGAVAVGSAVAVGAGVVDAQLKGCAFSVVGAGYALEAAADLAVGAVACSEAVALDTGSPHAVVSFATFLVGATQLAGPLFAEQASSAVAVFDAALALVALGVAKLACPTVAVRLTSRSASIFFTDLAGVALAALCAVFAFSVEADFTGSTVLVGAAETCGTSALFTQATVATLRICHTGGAHVAVTYAAVDAFVVLGAFDALFEFGVTLELSDAVVLASAACCADAFLTDLSCSAACIRDTRDAAAFFTELTV